MEGSSQPPPDDKPSQGNRRMAPPQASPDPWWPLLLVCYLLVWPVQYTIYTWSWNPALDGQRHHWICCGPNSNNHHRQWSLHRCSWDTWHRGLCRILRHINPQLRCQNFGFAHVDPKCLSFHVSLPEDQLLLQFLHRLSDNDQVICIQVFPGTSCTKP